MRQEIEEEGDFVDEKAKTVTLTEQGVKGRTVLGWPICRP